MECNEPKKKPKFTGGKGPKRLKGKHLWNKEGMTFFNTADKNWKKVYNDEKLSGVLYKKMVGRVRKKVANRGRI